MRKGEGVWEKVTERMDLLEESMPGQTIVELSGDNRVLIENHCGIKGYGSEKIVVRVRYGFVHVCGSCLELMRMSKEKLVIRGKIDQISLQRRS